MDNNKIIKITVIVLIILSGLILGIFLLYRSALPKSKAIEPAIIETKKSPITDGEILDAAGRHMIMPSGVPKIIKIEDIENLKTTQPFFANAQNGDRMLVYPDRVIIYSVDKDKIVEVAFIKN